MCFKQDGVAARWAGTPAGPPTAQRLTVAQHSHAESCPTSILLQCNVGVGVVMPVNDILLNCASHADFMLVQRGFSLYCAHLSSYYQVFSTCWGFFCSCQEWRRWAVVHVVVATPISDTWVSCKAVWSLFFFFFKYTVVHKCIYIASSQLALCMHRVITKNTFDWWKIFWVLNCFGSRWTNSQANTFSNLINSSMMSIRRISPVASWVIVLYV